MPTATPAESPQRCVARGMDDAGPDAVIITHGAIRALMLEPGVLHRPGDGGGARTPCFPGADPGAVTPAALRAVEVATPIR